MYYICGCCAKTACGCFNIGFKTCGGCCKVGAKCMFFSCNSCIKCWIKSFFCCGKYCENMCDVYRNCECCSDYRSLPFSNYSIIISFLYTLPAIVFAVIGGLYLSDSRKVCKYEHSIILLSQAFAYSLHILFCFYAVCRIGSAYLKMIFLRGKHDSMMGGTGIYQGLCKFICYDFIVLYYILFSVIHFGMDIVQITFVGVDTKVCREEYAGLISTAVIAAGWHMILTVVSTLLFSCIVFNVSLSENYCCGKILGICNLKQDLYL